MIFALYKNQGCYRLPPLKEISSRDLGRLERKIGLGNMGLHKLGGLPPLKENFVGELKLLSKWLLGLLISLAVEPHFSIHNIIV